ncbi:MAG: hypothetical protein V2A79_10970, partial [Planctomycetota bacterium]
RYSEQSSCQQTPGTTFSGQAALSHSGIRAAVTVGIEPIYITFAKVNKYHSCLAENPELPLQRAEELLRDHARMTSKP